MKNQQLQTYFFLGLLAIIFVITLFILRPFFGTLVVGVTFAVIFNPVYQFILRSCRGQKTVAALLTTILVLLLVITPLMIFSYYIFLEVQQFYLATADNQDQNISDVITTISQERLNTLFPRASIDFNEYTRQLASWVVQHLGLAFSSLAQLFIGIFLSLLTLYYTLKDGPRLLKAMTGLSPLLDRYDKEIFARLHRAVTSVIQGSLVIALLQGLATGIGFALFGVPHAMLWGSLAVISALIPNVGTAIVVVPGLIYLIVVNHIPAAVGLLIWGMTAVGLIDNLLGPKLIERGLKIHPFLILLAVLGGIVLFGPIGFIAGPLILSLLFALLDIYPLLLPNQQRS